MERNEEEEVVAGEIEEGGTSTDSGTKVDENWNVEVTGSNRLIFSSRSKEEEEAYTKESDLRVIPRMIWIVTTAALPWRTGTAVNPLLRALALVREGHVVTLLIPWLPKAEQRIQLYSASTQFETPDDQEAWIRDYCRNRCNAQEEEPKLRIQFWRGSYNSAFGSIFPTEDICSLVPAEQADVAILEEPEHLNWFRVPNSNSDNNKKDPHNELGWAVKFGHVVGILHTNYAAYMKQYGVGGTAFVTARALNALSSLVITAYCHVVIKLSDTLPSLLEHNNGSPSTIKEVTSNVHGVRDEFFPTGQDDEEDGKTNNKEPADAAHATTPPPAPVYFIGKVIWAKGFDLLLKLQEAYHDTTGEYFPMDIYGGGDDLKAIERAFVGRRRSKGKKQHIIKTTDVTKEDDAAEAVFNNTSQSLRQQVTSSTTVATITTTTAPKDTKNRAASEDTTNTTSSGERGDGGDGNSVHSSSASDSSSTTSEGEDDEQKQHTGGFEMPPMPPTADVLGQLTERVVQSGAETADASLKLVEAVLQHGIGAMTKMTSTKRTKKDTTTTTTTTPDSAAVDTNNTTTTTTSPKSKTGVVAVTCGRTPLENFLPTKSRFKWRKDPIPARFLGSKDHIEIRSLKEQKIFLNMSTTEVLCTTSAEALAMGKFVILPFHPSNTFFYQFDNCYSYETIEECVDYVQYALSHDPVPLTPQQAELLSWKGATERLYQAARLSKVPDNVEQRKAAKLHVDMARKSHFVTQLFSGPKALLKKFSSSSSDPNKKNQKTTTTTAAETTNKTETKKQQDDSSEKQQHHVDESTPATETTPSS